MEFDSFMVLLLKLVWMLGILGLFAFRLFGQGKFSNKFLPTLLLVVTTMYILFIAGEVWWINNLPILGMLIVGGWIAFQWFLFNSSSIPRKPRNIIVMERLATPQEAVDFAPDRYFRLRRNVGWRQLVLEIDDAIEIPGSTPIPVRYIGFGPPLNSNSAWIKFEYKGEVFYGRLAER